jgi:hypothetical protein
MSWRLLVHLALLPVCVWALVQLFDVSSAKAATGVAIWLGAAAVAHDFVLFPLYSGLDRGARRVNYVRVPAGLSLLLLLVFWGTIAGKGEGAYHAVSGRSYDGYATRWLLITAALFALSGSCAAGAAVRRRRARRAGASASSSPTAADG